MSHLSTSGDNYTNYADSSRYQPSLWESIWSYGLPLFVIGATVWALVDCVRRPVNRKDFWLILVLILPLIGPGLYFLFGRYKLQSQEPTQIEEDTTSAGPDRTLSETVEPSRTSWNVFRVVGSVISVFMVALGLVYVGGFLLIMLVLAQCKLSGGGGSKGCY